MGGPYGNGKGFVDIKLGYFEYIWRSRANTVAAHRPKEHNRNCQVNKSLLVRTGHPIRGIYNRDERITAVAKVREGQLVSKRMFSQIKSNRQCRKIKTPTTGSQLRLG